MKTQWLTLCAAAALLLSACSEERTCAAVEEQRCGDTCISVRTDTANCGACGNVCAAGQACQAGACVTCEGGACAADVFAACFNTDDVRGMTANLLPAAAPLAVEDGPLSLVRSGRTLFAVNGIENSLSLIALDGTPRVTGRVAVAAASQFGDLQHAAARNGRVYVLNSSAATLVTVDPASGTVLGEVPVGGAFSFPQSLDFVGSKAYVSLNGANQVAVVDVATVPGEVVKTIDVSTLASPGAVAMPARVRAVGNRVYVTLNNLSASFTPIEGANGKLAVIDAVADLLVAAEPSVDLGAGCKNASDLAISGTTLWVTCGWYDFFGTRLVQGGGFVPVELGASATAGPAVSTAQAPGSLVFCGGRGYAGDNASGTLLRLDPTSRTVESATVCPANVSGSAFVADVECAQ